jgi:ubiquinone/menaquinone biosynthesis C-methylase UbiE
MTVDDVRTAYGARAAEYTDLFGSIDVAAPADRDLVLRWALGCPGRIIDAGCGPGHWTEFLRQEGIDVEGVDVVAEFLSVATARFPDSHFRLASLDDLGVPNRSLAGVLSWYSLIHTEPDDIGQPLSEFARCIRVGGSLVVGFFSGPELEPFAHAVTTAYRWPVDALASRIENAGFVVNETQTRTDTGARPVGIIIADRISHRST